MCGVHLFFVGLKQTEGKSRYGRGFSRYSRQHSIDPGGIKIFTGILVKSQMTPERADEDVVRSTQKELIPDIFQSSLGLY